MADEFKRMRQLIGTTAEWAANDIVIGDGEIAAERNTSGQVVFKIGDGVKKFSQLPYASADLTPAMLKAGSTMTGPLTLSGDPTTLLGAATKQYVDKAAGLPTAVAPAAPATGDVWVDPATTPAKIKVWNGTTWIAVTPGAAATGATAPAAPTTGMVWTDNAGAQKIWTGTAWVPINANAGAKTALDIAGKLSAGGGTITGPLVIAAGGSLTLPVQTGPGSTAPTALQAVTQGFTEATYVNVAGDTMTGSLVLNADPAVALGAATKQYVDAADAATLAAIPAVPSGNWAPLGGLLVSRPYPAAKYAWIQYLDSGGANPYPTTNVPAIGTNSQSISYFMTNNMGKHDITNTTAALSAFTTVAASWPVAAMTNHWVFVPVMFDKTTTVTYIGTTAFQTTTSKYGQLRMQIFAADATTLAPSTMLRDCGVGTLASTAGPGAHPPVGTVIFVSTGGGYTFTAGTQYYIGVCYGYSDGSTTTGIAYQIGTITPGTNSSRLWCSGNYLPTSGSTLQQLATFWVGSSGGVQHTSALGSNPSCTNVVSWTTAMVLPHLFFST